jgi:hypothetical protein
MMKLCLKMLDLAVPYRKDWRRKRMQDMIDRMRLPNRSRIIDLGGSEGIWSLIDHDFHVTLVNLPGFNPPVSDPTHFSRIEGDACDLSDRFADGSFDAVFSNSTIEHVGDEQRQTRFAAEVRRLAPAFWVQTPSTLSPIEPHTSIPFYWRLPTSVREAILSNWNKQAPGWVDMLRETRVLSRQRMQELFPGSQLYVEHVLGIEKSYTSYMPCRNGD